MPIEGHAESLRRVNDAFNTGGVGAWRAVAGDLYDDDIEYHDSKAWPGGGAHRGRAAVIARFEEIIEVMGIFETVNERVVERGDEVAWVTRVVGRSADAEVPHEHR